MLICNDIRLSMKILWGALALLLLVSLNSLTTFPTPFDDEGDYAALGYNAREHGFYYFEPKGNIPSLFAHGDAIHSRVNPTLFGFLGSFTGDTLFTARAISFAFVWAAGAIFFWIARRLGQPAVLGPLLLLSAERVFYSSHVFRPESTLIFANTGLLALMLLPTSGRVAASRGAANGLVILSHGNGLVFCLLNSIEICIRWLRDPKRIALTIALYTMGGLLGVFLFYALQVRMGGGWEPFFAQLKNKDNYVPSTMRALLVSEVAMRWNRELLPTDGNIVAKALRIIYWASLIFISGFGFLRLKGKAKKLSALFLGSLLGYTFLVADKVDIHLSAMIPFSSAACLACLSAAPRAARSKLQAAIFGLLCIGFALTLHHGLKYRREAPYLTEAHRRVEELLLLKKANGEPQYPTLIGNMRSWFALHRKTNFVHMVAANQIREWKGGVITLDSLYHRSLLSHCKLEFSELGDRLQGYQCP